jgi:hypothetical protein
MNVQRTIVSVLSALLIIGNLPARGSGTIDSEKFERCLEVQRALSIPPSGRGIFDALLRVFAGSTDKASALARAKSFDELDAVATAVLAGSDPGALELMVLDVTNVANRYEVLVPPQWKFGDRTQRGVLVSRMWQRAKDTRLKDSANAQRLARAAMGILAQDTFGSSPVGLLHDPECASLVGLKSGEVAALLKIYTPPKSTGAERMARVEAVGEPLNRMIANGKADAQYQGDAQLLVKGFRSSWPGANGHDEQWRLANLLWRFNCLSKSNSDQNSVAQIASIVRDLTPQTSDPYAKRWLEEVLTVPGARPKDSGVRFFHEPNQLKPGKGP